MMMMMMMIMIIMIIIIILYICHRHETGFGKEMMRFGISIIFGLFGVDASRCTDK